MEIIVNNKKYQFSDRLTIEQWQAVMQYDFKNPMNWATIIHLVTGVPRQDLVKGNQETLELGAAIIVQMCNMRAETKIKPLDTLTFGEFVDIDSYVAMGLDKHLKAITAILAPDVEMSDQAVWALEQWIQYRTWIFRQYKELFDIYDEDSDPDEEDEVKMPDPESVARNWYKIIVDLANDDILKLDEVTDQPLIKALNFLALRKERRLEENMKIVEQNMKLKTPR